MTDQPTDPPVDEVDEQSTLLSNSAVMAAGTTVSRLTRLRPGRAVVLRPRQVVARRRLQRRELAAEHALHPAGRRHLQRRPGAAAGAVTAQRPRPRRRLHQPGRHRGRTVPDRGDGAAGGRGAVARRPRRPDVRRRGARLGDRLHPALPAAGLLLRDVRPGRADPQRSRVVRADDVGADRQQRDLRRGAGDLHRRLRPGRGRRGARSASPPARSCCSASARRSGSWSSC